MISKFIARVITGKPEKIFIEPPSEYSLAYLLFSPFSVSILMGVEKSMLTYYNQSMVPPMVPYGNGVEKNYLLILSF